MIFLSFERFPEVFSYLSQHPRDDSFFEDDLFKGKSGRMKELQDFISDIPCAKASKVAIGLKNLDEPIVKLIEEEVQKVIFKHSVFLFTAIST